MRDENKENGLRLVLNRENAKGKRKSRKKKNYSRRKESRCEKDFSVKSQRIRDIRDSKISHPILE